MEETLEGSRGPPQAVAPLERERERNVNIVELQGTKILTPLNAYVM
jgi:hypothetical protein